MAGDEEFYRKTILADEAHFHLIGYINKQRCYFWNMENPHAGVENQMHLQRVLVYCGFYYGGITEQFFVENDVEVTITVNGERSGAILTDKFFSEIEHEEMDNILF